MGESRKQYMTVREMAKLCKVSVRTLHYYDAIGLLVPCSVKENGYRLYDERNVERLQSIMLFRELEFPLKDIRRILDSPGFDTAKALDDQIRLLELKRDHFEDLITHARQMRVKEELKMDFKAYDKSRIDSYRQLAKETWGDTEAYKEYEERCAGQSDTEKRKAAEDLMELFYEFGDLKVLDPGDAKVQAQVRKLKDFITDNYYTCTETILKSLGQIYSAGGEMTDNIDAAGGRGCAGFVSRAIELYTE